MVELKCKYVGCNNVEKDGKTMAEAIDFMKFHISALHGNRHGGGRGLNRKKIYRLKISEEATGAMWKVFLSDWEH